jgi:hypothetical protein
MRSRSHRQSLVVWSWRGGYGAQRFTRLTRTRRIRRLIRTGALFAVIGLMRLARAVHTRRGSKLLLAGSLLTITGMMLPNAVALICGMLVLLRGVAVILGVSEPHRRLDGAPAGGPDYFGFGTPALASRHGRGARAVTGR